MTGYCIEISTTVQLQCRRARGGDSISTLTDVQKRVRRLAALVVLAGANPSPRTSMCGPRPSNAACVGSPRCLGVSRSVTTLTCEAATVIRSAVYAVAAIDLRCPGWRRKRVARCASTSLSLRCNHCRCQPRRKQQRRFRRSRPGDFGCINRRSLRHDDRKSHLTEWRRSPR